MGSGDPRPVRRVLLVGFMGSGKSTTGRLLATRLGWEFHDLDHVIEARSGATIPELFRERGEEGFRALEAQVAAEFLHRSEAVVVPGGGWPCRPGRMDGLGPETLSVWLQVEPQEAVRRVEDAGGGRPLLEGRDPEAAARRLLEERIPYYRKALVHLDTAGRTPEEVAELIAVELSSLGTGNEHASRKGNSTNE